MRDFRSLVPALAVLLFASTSCHRHTAHQVKVVPVRAPKASHKPPTAVAIAMDRQVKNAIDAGEGDALVRYLRQKVAADPDHVAARLELAAQYQKVGAYELAIEHFRIAVARRPEDESALRRLSQALQANDQSLEAISVLASFCETHLAASSGLLEELALLEDESGALSEGERFHRRAIQADARDDSLRNNLGYNFLQQSRYDDAAHEFQAALQLNPASEAARNNLAMAMAKAGKNEEAILQWSSILGPAAAHNNLAAVLIEQSRFPGARKEIEAALSYDRYNPAAMRNLQLMSELDGKPASFTMGAGGRAETHKNASRWGRLPGAISRMLHPAQTRNSGPKASTPRVAGKR